MGKCGLCGVGMEAVPDINQRARNYRHCSLSSLTRCCQRGIEPLQSGARQGAARWSPR